MCRTASRHCRSDWTPERRALENARARISRNAGRKAAAEKSGDKAGAARYDALAAAATEAVARLLATVETQGEAITPPPAPAVSTRMEMTWVRRKGSSLNYGNFGSEFGQDIEPAGRYISQREDGGRYDDDLYDSGTITFENPLLIDFGGGYDDDDNWKRRLTARYGGKTGKKLSLAIKADGYDAVVTSDKYGLSEVVDLTDASFRK